MATVTNLEQHVVLDLERQHPWSSGVPCAWSRAP
jgi:hypothetical protein